MSLGHWLAFGILWLAAMGLVVVFTYPHVIAGAQIDADGYMRLVRVELLVEEWRWFDNRIPRSNWPFGDELHWTRPLDLLIVLLAFPLMPFLGGSAGLQASGTLISPLLHLASCLALIWVVAPITSLRVRALAAPALLVQPVVLVYGLPGRADHHALIGFLFVLALGFALRWILDPARERAALATGLVCALGIWVSPEFLLPLAIFFLAGSLLWIRHGPSGASANLSLTGGLALGLTLALPLERSAREWLTVEYDRISIAHWTMGLVALAFWLVVTAVLMAARRPPTGATPQVSVGTRLAASGWPRRTGAAIVGGVGAAAVLHLIHPDFFRGPWISTYVTVQEIWLQHVAELQPLWPRTAADVGKTVAAVGLAPVALGMFAWRAAGAARHPGVAGAARGRTANGAEDRDTASARRSGPAGPDGAPTGAASLPLWIFLLVSGLLYTLMALWQARWGLYAGVVYGVGTVAFLDPALARADAALRGTRRRVVRLALIAVLMPGVLLAGYALAGLLAPGGDQADPTPTAGHDPTDPAPTAERDQAEAALVAGTVDRARDDRCRLSRIAPLLSDPEVTGSRVTTVLAHVDRGPEILHRTPHRVLAGPYHRNRRGIMDIYETFTRPPDDPRVRAVLEEREIGLVVLCPERDRGFLARGGDGSTYHRLVEGPLPDWARLLDLPEDRAGGFLVFRVEGPLHPPPGTATGMAIPGSDAAEPAQNIGRVTRPGGAAVQQSPPSADASGSGHRGGMKPPGA